MGVIKIDIEKFIELAQEHPVLDVRSPSEYKHAHIPGAISLPLFTDEERKVVGTIYKQESREKAIKAGLDFFSPKMRSIIETAESICKSKPTFDPVRTDEQNISENLHNLKSKILLVHCWRGGMRSSGIAWLLDLYGFKVFTLIGGYKKFRNYVLETFSLPTPLNVLGGYTGSGKTEILEALDKAGEKIIDLEKIANHKGSAFGNIGMPEQPGQEMFENMLAIELRKKIQDAEENNKRIWIEDESQRIGLVNLPSELWANMRLSPLYFLNISFEERLSHIVSEYGQLDQQKVIDAINRIREKLGGLNAKNAISLLEENNKMESFRILLNYYDKYYLKALHNRKGLDSLLQRVECKSVTPENAQLLVSQQQTHLQKL
jgi:tRNA 2-selenouridine synthase